GRFSIHAFHSFTPNLDLMPSVGQDSLRHASGRHAPLSPRFGQSGRHRVWRKRQRAGAVAGPFTPAELGVGRSAKLSISLSASGPVISPPLSLGPLKLSIAEESTPRCTAPATFGVGAL